MDRMDVVVMGGASTEFVARGSHLPDPGSAALGDTFLRAPGGKGLCFSIAAARLGASAALVARIGTDERGEEALSRCRAEGVMTSAVAQDPEVATGVTLTMMDAEGRSSSMAVPGANGRLCTDDVKAAAELLAGTLVLLVDLSLPPDAARQAIDLAHAAGARVIADPGSLDLAPADLLRGLDILECTAREADVLTGVEVLDRTSALRAAENLLLRGARAAVVQVPGGHLALSREGSCWIPNLPTPAEGKMGSEEAFTAALAVATAWGEDLFDAAWFASGAWALAMKRPGTISGLPRQEEVVSYLHEHRRATLGRQIEHRIASAPREAAPASARDPGEAGKAPRSGNGRVDEASLESFPASDPPAWSPGHA